MKKNAAVFLTFVLCFSLFGQLYISEVSDAVEFNNEFLEIYNNSGSAIDLTNYKLVRVDAGTNNAEYVFDFGTNESGSGSDLTIPAFGIMVIDRGNNRSTFEIEWGTMDASVAFNNGNSVLYFGTVPARRWRLRGDDGTADTDDGTLLDDTGQAVAGSNNRHYQRNIGGPWISDSRSNATPGSLDGDQSLPVTLTSFTACGSNSKVNLKWVTESEVDNQGFYLYRSLDREGDYKQLSDLIKGASNSSARNEYNYIDNTVSNGHIYWYKLVSVELNGIRTEHPVISALPHVTLSDIDIVNNSEVPKKFALKNNYPNPFNPETIIGFDVPVSDNELINIDLSVYDMLGKKVKTLINEPLGPNSYAVKWNGTNDYGRLVPSGVYVYLLISEAFIKSNKMILIR